jgi:PIN domain nuclease of toxin-antitoxin system
VILLDTHIWYWWVSGQPRLSERQAKALSDSDQVVLSAISVWELCTKVASGKMTFDRPFEAWLDGALDNPRLSVVPVTFEIAVESSRLPGEFHKDPADRMIVASARLMDLDLVTADRKILGYPNVRTIG